MDGEASLAAVRSRQAAHTKQGAQLALWKVQRPDREGGRYIHANSRILASIPPLLTRGPRHFVCDAINARGLLQHIGLAYNCGRFYPSECRSRIVNIAGLTP